VGLVFLKGKKRSIVQGKRGVGGSCQKRLEDVYDALKERIESEVRMFAENVDFFKKSVCRRGGQRSMEKLRLAWK